MWSLLGKKAQVSIILVAGLLSAWSIDAVYALALHKEAGLLKTLSLAVTIVGTILVAVAEAGWRWLWRQVPLLGRKAFPDLNGKWDGTLRSTWINPETGQPIDPIPTRITVRQRLFSTSVTLKTGESESHSTRCILERLPEIGRFRIWYSYNNDPIAQVRHRSSPHEGVAYLEFDPDASPDALVGRYYTARKTTGDIEVTRGTRD
ncbi:hypothetical protein BSL82_10285 [Tardibacter chloracetimidivorans]|uniref:CD-NTase-associated protein 15 domain-containing protein n=1 Tax=Tardibacter chloracetimidivorans TaxID=1921510 RepID=A0A1L3ZVP0_9SPHN|nr:hypothetical protein [Tardibacter chloracetimidivorans]API59660.1 hypothetical protein BSL82_10285 [Tardibacter chloracetimidivorans]